jgi:hypothetical protein
MTSCWLVDHEVASGATHAAHCLRHDKASINLIGRGGGAGLGLRLGEAGSPKTASSGCTAICGPTASWRWRPARSSGR